MSKGYNDDPIELKDPDYLENACNQLLEEINKPENKELDFIHRHFKLYNDDRFKVLVDKAGALFNKILKGEFDDKRNQEVLKLVLRKMRQMKEGEITIKEGEVEIGVLLNKLFPVKKKDTTGHSKSELNDLKQWKQEYKIMRSVSKDPPKEFEIHYAVLTVMEENKELNFVDNNNIDKELKLFNKMFKEMSM